MFFIWRKQSIILCLITILSLMSFAFSSFAAAPTNIVTYQGRLLNSNSVPVSDTSLSMKFFFYTAVTAGTCVWSNSSASCDSNTPASTTARTVTLTSGLFTQNLGDTGDSFAAIGDSIFADNSTLFLEVIVGSETLSPRRRLTAAPYALNSQTLDGLSSADFLRDTGDTATGIFDFTVAVLSGASPFVFEGVTANDFESTFAFTDPTVDRTITFQNASGTVAFLTDITASQWETGTFVYEDDSAVVVGTDVAFTYASGGVGDLRVADQLEVLDDVFIDNDLVVGASTSATETIANINFSLGGNDLFVAGDAGIENALYIDGVADGTDALIMTAGDILLSNGDFDLSGGDFNVTLDTGDVASITSSATASAAALNVVLAGTSDASLAAVTIDATATNQTNRTVAGLFVYITSQGTLSTDVTRGIFLDIASEAGATDKAIEIENTTAAWDTDIELQNDETISNTVDGTIALTATTVTTSGDLTVTGGDITGSNGEIFDIGTTNSQFILELNSDSTATLTVSDSTNANTPFTISAAGTGTLSLSSAGIGAIVVGDGDDSLMLNAAGNVFIDDSNFTGTGSLNISSAANTGLSLDSPGGTGVITIGSNPDAVTIVIASGIGVDTVNIGAASDIVRIVSNTLSLTDNNWSITAAGVITTDGDLAVNGDDITADGILTIDAGNTVQLGTDDDFLPQLGVSDADIGASATRWDNVFATTGNFSGTVTIGTLSTETLTTTATTINLYDLSGVNKTIDIGSVTNDSANTINIATNGTSVDTISIGNTAGGTAVNISGGTIDLEGAVTIDLTTIVATQFAVCHTNSDTNDEPIGDCSGAPTADYAEQYPVEAGITYGDVVVPGTMEVTTTDGHTITSLVKSGEPYQGPIVGIVSDNYGDFTSAGYNIAAGDNPMPIALIGRVPVKVTDEGGAIYVGDYLTTSSTAGRAMKASKVGRVIGMALQDWDGVSDTIMVQVNNSWYMGEVIGTDGVSTLVTDNVVVSSFATATVEAQTFDSYGLSLRGSAWNGSEAEVVEMMMRNVVESEDKYRLSIRNTSETEVAYITNEGTMKIAGDMMIGGNLYPSDRGVPQTEKYIYYDGSEGAAGDFMRTNAKGWSTGSYDFAEMFPSSETLESGEVVAFSGSGHNIIRAVGVEGEQLAGIVSTSPGFLAGENAEGSYPIALAGRVPTRVSADNGVIAVGDPLTSGTVPGIAVKATENGQIVGYALEAYVGTESDNLILVYVNIGYWAGEEIVPVIVQNTASEVSGNTNFSALNMTGNISMNSYEVNSIGKLTGMGDAWSLTSDGTLSTSGLLKTVIDSYQNEKVETVAVTSPEVMITLTGTAILENDQLEIRFEDVIPEYNDVISAIAPIRVFVTPSGPVSLYVSEKDQNHFVVTRFAGDQDVEFDWMVSAYRKGYEPVEEVDEVVQESVEVFEAIEALEALDTTDTASPASSDETIVDSATTVDGGESAEPPTESL